MSPAHLELAVHGIVLQQVAQGGHIDERVVDGNDLDVGVIQGSPEHQPADAAEAIDSHANPASGDANLEKTGCIAILKMMTQSVDVRGVRHCNMSDRRHPVHWSVWEHRKHSLAHCFLFTRE